MSSDRQAAGKVRIVATGEVAEVAAGEYQTADSEYVAIRRETRPDARGAVGISIGWVRRADVEVIVG
jgi:hypothetical protein